MLWPQKHSSMEKSIQVLHARKTKRNRKKMIRDLVEKIRINNGRNANPTCGLINLKSAKTTDKAVNQGIDEEKTVKERKRHSVTDTQGHIFHVKVHTVAGCKAFDEAGVKYPSLKGVCPVSGYRKTLEEFVRHILDLFGNYHLGFHII
ncbi:hypothetical protein K737_300250 [Holospora undulata HU1]|uniref:Uncharacterized protein n=2 Tax=Holospora TaxID=44747 RepID=A0A061JIX3_9PROT|nr:hypothetical protein K737_300250 [Holospora undulata HU1]